MIRLVILFLFLFSAPALAGLMSPFPSSMDQLSIPNSHDVDGVDGIKLVRGQRPFIEGRRNKEKTLAFMKELYELKITDILIFKNQVRGEVDDQLELTRTLNRNTSKKIRTHHISFHWKDITSFRNSCEQVIKAMSLMKKIMQSRTRKLFYHCTVGEDRTGMLSGLWRMVDQGWTVEKAFREEMCARGYAGGNPRKPYTRVVREIREDLTPLFIVMSKMVEEGLIKYESLDKQVCEAFEDIDVHADTEAEMRKFRCKKAELEI